MKATILYESDEKLHSAERFLSKQDLVKIFGAGAEVSRTITYRRRRLRLNHSKKDIQAVVKKNYPVYRQKSRAVNLY